jgi:hypothetical protein
MQPESLPGGELINTILNINCNGKGEFMNNKSNTLIVKKMNGVLSVKEESRHRLNVSCCHDRFTGSM